MEEQLRHPPARFLVPRCAVRAHVGHDVDAGCPELEERAASYVADLLGEERGDERGEMRLAILGDRGEERVTVHRKPRALAEKVLREGQGCTRTRAQVNERGDGLVEVHASRDETVAQQGESAERRTGMRER